MTVGEGPLCRPLPRMVLPPKKDARVASGPRRLGIWTAAFDWHLTQPLLIKLTHRELHAGSVLQRTVGAIGVCPASHPFLLFLARKPLSSHGEASVTLGRPEPSATIGRWAHMTPAWRLVPSIL